MTSAKKLSWSEKLLISSTIPAPELSEDTYFLRHFSAVALARCLCGSRNMPSACNYPLFRWARRRVPPASTLKLIRNRSPVQAEGFATMSE